MAAGKIVGKFIPAPRGLKYGDVLVSGIPEYANRLIGLIPRRVGLVTPETFASVGSAAVNPKTLITYRTTGLFFATNTGIYPYNTGVAAIALTQGLGWPTEVNTAATSYALFFNGTDIPKIYDGAAWANAAWGGPTLTNLFQGLNYRGRLYLMDKTGQRFWYLAAGAIAGAATVYDCGTVFKTGGSIIAAGTLSLDGGLGPDDLLCVYNSTGEVAIFSGNDPAATDWRVVGVYNIGAPACGANFQPRVLAALGGDLLIYTAQGIYSLTKLIRGEDVATAQSISANIDPYIQYQTRQGLSNSCTLAVLKSLKLLVVTFGGIGSTHVLELETKEWCELSGPFAGPVYATEANGVAYICSSLTNTIYNYSTAAAGPPGWSIYTQFGRLGSFDRIRPQMLRPLLYNWTDGAAVTNANPFTLLAGYATDLSSDYNPFTGGGTTSNSLSSWDAAGNFSRDWVFGTKGRFYNKWTTLQNEMSPGMCLSLYTNGAPSYATDKVQTTQFLGWDLTYEQISNLGP